MKTEEKPLFIVFDGNALVHRAYHALPPLTTKDGVFTSGLYGFLTIFLKVMQSHSPTYCAVAFDRKEATFRHEAYDQYKAHREKKPQELYDQIPLIQEVLMSMNIAVLEKPGFEADDIIGTIAHRAPHELGARVLIVTGDMDALQLVNEDVQVFTLKKGISDTIIYDIAGVQERYEGLNPLQVIDYKALCGDASDNIPGVSGIGAKTAIHLVRAHGTIEDLYQALDAHAVSASAKILTALTTEKETAFLSKRLATIVTDVPIEQSLESMQWHGGISPETITLLEKYEMKSLVSRFSGSETTSSNITTARQAETPHSPVIIVKHPAELTSLMSTLRQVGAFAFDTETTSLNPLHASLVCITFAWGEDDCAFLDLRDPGSAPALIELVRPLFEDPAVAKYGHNIKFDYTVLHHAGITTRGMTCDTMIAAYLLNPGERSYGLDVLARKHFGYEMMLYTELVASPEGELPITEVAQDRLISYATDDARITWRLAQKFLPELTNANAYSVFTDIEMPLIPILSHMETAGVSIDKEFLHSLSVKLTEEKNKLTGHIYELAGHEFNINSPAQIQTVLFETLQLPTAGIGKTKTGISTSADELIKLREAHPIIEYILQYRELAKLISTYIDALPKLIDPTTKRVHTAYNQTVASTGRLSSSNPNLQNIPTRTEAGREIRKAFIARDGYSIVSVDYSQMELRIVAHLAQDKNMLQAFREGKDIHTLTASLIHGIPESEVSKDMRRAAKAINFGIIYGLGANGLAQDVSITRKEAQKFIDAYFDVYTGIRTYMDATIAYAREHGYVETLFGRRRYLPDIHAGSIRLQKAAERMAINHPVQGTEADIIKLAMINTSTHPILREHANDCVLIMQVHDELVFEIHRELIPLVLPAIRECMESVITLDVPIITDAEAGATWGDLHAI